jgi:hypothetical protein
VHSRAVGKQGAHLGVETGGIIEREMELLRPPRSSSNYGRLIPGAAPLGPLSGKMGSAKGCCRAILR